MKDQLIAALQFILGYQRYLKYFARIKIRFLSAVPKKADFLFFESLFAENACLVVVGANVGITTIPLAKGKAMRKVFAYEPFPSNFEVLEQMISHYKLKNVQAFSVALGDKQTEKEMLLPLMNGARKQGLACLEEVGQVFEGKGERKKVQVDKIDARPELQSEVIHGLKVVAENYEYNIFLGAQNMIQKHKPLIYCELQHNEHRLKVFELIRSYGYDIFVLENKNFALFDPNRHPGRNFFFQAI